MTNKELDDIPEVGEDWFRKAKLVLPEGMTRGNLMNLNLMDAPPPKYDAAYKAMVEFLRQYYEHPSEHSDEWAKSGAQQIVTLALIEAKRPGTIVR